MRAAVVLLLAVMTFPIEATAQSAYARGLKVVRVPYTDGNGENKTADALPINSTNNDVTLDGGWYFVKDNVTINGQLQFTGDAHIILCNRSQMTADSFIRVAQCIASTSMASRCLPTPLWKTSAT